MIIGKEDLGLTLSLNPTITTATNCRSRQLNLLPSFSSLGTDLSIFRREKKIYMSPVFILSNI
jgi:hypothetical protein